jgi:hypothetical protein
MRNALLVLSCIAVAACSSAVTEQRVEQDFRRVLLADYKNIDLKKVQRVAFGDGWDDGVEVRVYFEGSCKPATTAASVKRECPKGPMHMQMSYQKRSGGEWEILATRIVGGS